MFQQHSDAGLEVLQFAVGRAFAFGKPHQILFLFQNDRAKSESRARGASRLDWQNFSKPAQKAHHRVRKRDASPASPVRFAQMFPAQHRSHRERIEITNMVKRENASSILRQMLQPSARMRKSRCINTRSTA